MDYREQAESLLYDAKDWAGDPHIRKDLHSAAQSITDLLARAEAAEARVHGRWVKITEARVDTTGFCSVCGEEAVWRTYKHPYHRCPHCGAKMDGAN